jgi:hypothetical protein
MAYLEDKAAQARALVGKRVEIPVHYDLWMRGARFGRVTAIGKDSAFVYVHMDHPQVKRRLKVWRVDFDYMRVED